MFKIGKKIYTALFIAAIATMIFVSALPPITADNGTTAISVIPAEPLNIIDPSIAPGSTIIINASVFNVIDLYTWQVKIFFDKDVLNCTDAYYPSDHIFAGKPIVPVTPIIDNVAGFVMHGASLMGVPTGVSGNGRMCQIKFKVLSRGVSGLNFSKPYGGDTFLLNYDMDTIPAVVNNGYFNNKLPTIPQPPVANFDYSPKPPLVSQVTTFDASASYDPDGTIISYQWNFGDGGFGSGKIATHTYTSKGSYTVTLTVIDNDEKTNSTSKVVDVQEVAKLPPIAKFDYSPKPPKVGDIVTFDASGSYDPDGTIIGYAWNFGDDTSGSGKIVTHKYTSQDTYTVVLTVTDNDGLTGTVSVFVNVQSALPPVGIQVKWANWSSLPQYPFGGQYHSGAYPVWKNFTVLNGGAEDIIYIAVTYPLASPNFKPSKYLIQTFPYATCWDITVNLDDRLVEFSVDEEEGIIPGGYAIVSIEFIQGPTAEDCTTGHEFAITVTERTTHSWTFYLTEYIDKTAPQVKIVFPDASTPGGKSFTFIKKKDGYIWVLMPNCTDKKIGWLWINGTASDECSGINRVEIWINGTYMGDATLSGPVGSKSVKWWWYTDPTKNPTFWETESWYNVTARAYDNSVNNELFAKGRGKIPRTNNAETTKWFFWIGVEGPVVTVCFDKKPIDWAPGNGRIDVWGQTGFYPNENVEIWLENELYGVKKLLTTVTTDYYGRFYTTINHLPEVPRKPTCADYWVIRAFMAKGNLEGADRFAIIPWITYEDTMAQNDPKPWQTTKKGYVGDTIMVYGHGFLPSRHTIWDRYSTVYVRIVYTDVAPLEKWDYRRVFNGTGQFTWDNLEWYPRLSEVILAEVTTDANGYWKAQITIPQSYGGLHAIYAYEYKIVTDIGMPGPKTNYVLVKSGWPECTGVKKEEQAAIFDVWPTIKVSPTAALVNQYITITGEGLPLPRHYRLLKNGKSIVERDWCLVLDFGPFEQWVYENKRIRNNEFDLSWAMGAWYPFAFYSPDPASLLEPESLVWHGKLCSVLYDRSEYGVMPEQQPSQIPGLKPQIHLGSKFLKVPILTAGNYSIMLYYYDKNAEEFTYDHDATTNIRVLKDPLNVNLEVGATHFPGEIVTVYVKIDVDGIMEDATTILIQLYNSTSVRNLDPKPIEKGLYKAEFTVPSGAKGDYFIKAIATKTYDTITLYGSGTAAFAVNPSLEGINAKLQTIQDKIAVLQTDVGTIKVDFYVINAKLTGIDGNVASIKTDVGNLKIDIKSVNATVTRFNGELATVDSKLGSITTTLDAIESKVTIEGDSATITSALGDIKGKVKTLTSDGKYTLATISTDIGEIKTKVNSIEGNTGLQPASVGLSLIAAIAAIAAAVLILRKVYTK